MSDTAADRAVAECQRKAQVELVRAARQRDRAVPATVLAAERRLRLAELGARACGAFETAVDAAIVADHAREARLRLMDAWLDVRKRLLELEACRGRDRHDELMAQLEVAEDGVKYAIFVAQEWGLIPDQVVVTVDPEGKF